ncbi:MAG: hemolysin family protein [Candidatus Saccharimonadales bacterium]
MIEILLIVIGLLLVLACGVFVAAEFAFVTVNRARIERMAEAGDVGATGVREGLRTLSTQLSGAQVGITITNLAIGFLAEPAVAELLRGPLGSLGLNGAAITTVALVLAISVATIVTMLFGELVPKNLAIAHPIGTAKAIQRPMRLFSNLMRWPIMVMNGTANRILRQLDIEPREELASARSVEELLSVVKHSAKRGTLTKDTAILVERSLEFSDRHASDVMTPRVKLETVDQSQPVSQVILAAKRSGFSRFPVIDKEIDNIVGITSVKKAVTVPFEERGDVPIETIMVPVIFVPSSMELDDLIEKMRDESVEVVVAIDEFGGVDGIVALEDLIEELVGEVIDEHDESGMAIKKLRRNVWSVSGLLRSDEVGQVTGLILPEDEEYETIGGLVFDQLDEVPDVGDHVTVMALTRDGTERLVQLRVLAMDGRRIDRLELSIVRQKGDQS